MFLNRLEIRNFRCLQNLTLQDLKQVNVVVGKNNTGKTTLLEAIFFHSAASNPGLAFNLRTHRGFDSDIPFPPVNVFVADLFRDLFCGFDTASAIELTSRDSSGNQRRSIITLGTSGIKQLEIPGVEGVKERGVPLVVEYIDAQNVSHISRLVIGRRGIEVQDGPTPGPTNGVILPSNFRVSQVEDAQRLDALIREKRKEQVIELAKIIEPNLTDLALGFTAGQAMVRCDVGLPELVPLPVLGEGTHKLISIALAILAVPRGVIMIDEIENGVYYDRQEEFWLKLYRLLEAEHVQLFVTTHSHECLEALESAASNSPSLRSNLKLVRLAKENDQIYASEYEFPAFQSALATGFEIR